MYSYGPPHMAGQKQDDQLEHIYSSYVRIRDLALKPCQRQWTIGRSGERGSGISVLAARHDDDDDDDDVIREKMLNVFLVVKLVMNYLILTCLQRKLFVILPGWQNLVDFIWVVYGLLYCLVSCFYRTFLGSYFVDEGLVCLVLENTC